jgi:AcrR family transcriptional regulator
MKEQQANRPLGRPRAFDTDEALDAAMMVFWRDGYEGTSLATLTEAMGINRPSLYAAFGDKEALFHKVLDRYTEGPAAYVGEALRLPTARAVVEALLQGAVNVCASSSNPRGCLLIQGGLSCGAEAKAIQKALVARRNEGEKLLARRLKRARSEGDLPSDANPVDLARYIVTVVRGLGVQAAGGASHAELQRVVQVAMKSWPT